MAHLRAQFLRYVSSILSLAFCLLLAPGASSSEGKLARCELSSTGGTANGRSSYSWDAGSQRCVDGSGTCSASASFELPSMTGPPVGAVAASLASASPAPLSDDSCSRVSLSSQIHWISSATWLESTNDLLVVDPIFNRLLRVSRGGIVSSENGAGIAMGPRLPVHIESLNASYLLSFVDSSVTVFDSFFKNVQGGGSLTRSFDGTPNQLGTLSDWAASAGDLIGYGSYHSSGSDAVALGFVAGRTRTVPFSVSGVQVLLPFSYQQYYLLGHHYVTSNSSGLFFLAMNNKAKLFWYSPSQKKLTILSSFPVAYETIPELRTELSGPRDAQARFAEIETLRIPVGIYAQGDFIYILTREPRGTTRDTKWLLHKIDPAKNQFLGSVQLPTSANHLSVVPSPRHWYFFEKGRVEPTAGQSIPSLLAIPTKWLTDPRSSPLAKEIDLSTFCKDSHREKGRPAQQPPMRGR
jgi:hypothetical protein